jgi:hypothetical protein
MPDAVAKRGHDLAGRRISWYVPGMADLGDEVKQRHEQDGDRLARVD